MKKQIITAVALLVALTFTGCSSVNNVKDSQKEQQNESGDSSNLSNVNNSSNTSNENNKESGNNTADNNQQAVAPVLKKNTISQEYTNKAKDKLTIDINFPTIENEGDSNSFKLVNKSLNEYAQFFIANINVFVEEFQTDSYEYPENLEYELSYDIKMLNDKYLSISYTVYSSLGGPHPDLQPFSKTYDLLSGEEITLDKVFNISEDEYKELILEYVMEQTKENFKDDENFIDSLDTSYLKESIKPDRFYISDNNLVIYFYSYDFMCYAVGNQEFFIPLDDINDKLSISFSEE